MPETALLMDIKKFAVHDGPGVRTTFFLKGCTLRCIWCHNPEGISASGEMAYYAHKCISCGECIGACSHQAHAIDQNGHVFMRENCAACGACEAACLGEAMKLFGKKIGVEEAVRIALEDKIFYANSNGGVTVSGGEPLTYPGFIADFFAELKKDSIHTAVDTCGNVQWSSFEKVLPVTDMFLYDIKHIDTYRHKELTGSGNERILDNLGQLSAAGKRIEIRMPFVPGYNSDRDTLSGIGEFLSKLNIERMKVLPYHSMARSKYAALGKKDTMPVVDSPSDEAVNEAVSVLKSFGINAVSGRD